MARIQTRFWLRRRVASVLLLIGLVLGSHQVQGTTQQETSVAEVGSAGVSLPQTATFQEIPVKQDRSDSAYIHQKRRNLAATSETNSYIVQGNTDLIVGFATPITLIVQAVDVNGAAQTSGGDIFYMRVEQQCNVAGYGNLFCEEDAGHSNLAGLPLFTLMTDNGDGTYQADYSFTGGVGTSLTVSAELVTDNGMWIEYYNNKNFVGVPDIARFETSDINYDWGGGLVTSSKGSNVSVRWWTKLVVPYTETYTWVIDHDPAFRLWIDGILEGDFWFFAGPQQHTMTLNLEAGRIYDLRMDLSEGSGTCFNMIQWSSPSIPSPTFVPSSALFKTQRIGGDTAVHTITVEENPSVPSTSTIETHDGTVADTDHSGTTFGAGTVFLQEAGTALQITMQSRNSAGNILTTEITDTYAVVMTQIGGSSQVYSTTATHQSLGLYMATLNPEIAGDYTMTVHMTNAYTAAYSVTNTEVSGSPYTVTVYAGQVDPLQCYTDWSGSPTTDAGTDFAIDIFFVDVWGNLHEQTMQDELDAGMTVTVVADYDNHDNWQSPISIPDLTTWTTDYGTSINGASLLAASDGTVSETVPIVWAGTYTVTVEVDGTNVVGSPYTSLEVHPTVLSAPECVADGIPTLIYAGFDYSFQVQGRDQYHNNLQTTLASAVGADYSIVPSLSTDPLQQFTGTVSDYAGNNGVYQVDMAVPKTQTAGFYDLNLFMGGGQEVPTTQVQIEPCSNSIALGLGILTSIGTTTTLADLDYPIEDPQESITLPVVSFHCDHDPIQVLTQAIVTFENGTSQALTESQLATYGISLDQAGPTIEVQSNDIIIGNAVFQLEISDSVVEEPTWQDFTHVTINYLYDPSVPSTSTIETHDGTVADTDHSGTTFGAGTVYLQEAGTALQITMQSRNSAGNILTTEIADTYAVVMTQIGGSSQVYSTTATHQSLGLYMATLNPEIAGDYTMTVHMTNAYTAAYSVTNTEVSGSPYTVTVYAGQVDPLQCYTDWSGSPTTNAGTDFAINIFLVDVWGNLHEQTMQDELDAGMTVTVVADYDNHDNWPSPISIPDLATWTTDYGTSINGASLLAASDGSISETVPIVWAGTYTVTVEVDGTNIIGSPYTSLEVHPTVLSAPECVADGIPALIYAGFDYSFQVQGRDQFHNNLQTTLASAVGTDYSIIPSLSTDPSQQFTGTVSDYAGNNGVYQVDMTIPKTQTGGYYNLNLLMNGGQEVPTTQVQIEPCSNFVALGLGLLSSIGTTAKLDPLDYTIKTDQESIELPVVTYYCEHQPVQVIISVSVTTENGAIWALTEAQLNNYGIILEQHSAIAGPTIKIFSENTSFANAVFQLEISNSVVEEPSWKDLTRVTINYLYTEPVEDLDYEPWVPPSQIDAPRFDPESTSDSTLQMLRDESGKLAFAPLTLDCSEPWSKALPQIEGENAQISVSLGDAGLFLDYNVLLREFSHQPKPLLEVYEVGRDYSIVVQLSNPNNNLTTYVISLRVECDELEEQASAFAVDGVEEEDLPLYSYELRFDSKPPVPVIHSISLDGLVRIRFNATMQEGAALTEDELIPTTERDSRVLASSEDSIDVIGQVTETFSNFTKIHNSTVRINGTVLESLSVRIEPDDPDLENQCAKQLQFVWEVVGFTPDELTLQLYFIWPECVSSATSEGDFLVVIFNDQRLFKDINKRLIWPQTMLKARIKRQITLKSSEEGTLAFLESLAATMMIGSTALILLQCLCLRNARGLKPLSQAFKRLQIVVFTLLIRVQLAAHTESFLLALKRMLTFRFFDTEKISADAFSISMASPIDVHFESMGFKTSDMIINLSSIITLVVIMMAIATIAYLFKRFASPNNLVWVFLDSFKDDESLLQRLSLFIDWFFLVFVICYMINVYQRAQSDQEMNRPSHTLAITLLMSIPAYLIVLFTSLIWQLNERIKSRAEGGDDDKPMKEYEITREWHAISFHLISFVRRVALAIMVTFGRVSFFAQLMFVNFTSVSLIVLIGTLRPFERQSDFLIELWNEFCVLLIYGQCLLQTDYVEDPQLRLAIAWVLNGLIALSVLSNFGLVLYQEGSFTVYRVRLDYKKSQFMAKEEYKAQKQTQINNYRRKVLQEVCQEEKKVGQVNLHLESLGDARNNDRGESNDPNSQVLEQKVNTNKKKIMFVSGKLINITEQNSNIDSKLQQRSGTSALLKPSQISVGPSQDSGRPDLDSVRKSPLSGDKKNALDFLLEEFTDKYDGAPSGESAIHLDRLYSPLVEVPSIDLAQTSYQHEQYKSMLRKFGPQAKLNDTNLGTGRAATIMGNQLPKFNLDGRLNDQVTSQGNFNINGRLHDKEEAAAHGNHIPRFYLDCNLNIQDTQGKINSDGRLNDPASQGSNFRHISSRHRAMLLGETPTDLTKEL